MFIVSNSKWRQRVIKKEADECWSYDGAQKDGRPYMRDTATDKTHFIVHLLWREVHGNIPGGHILHHTCLNKWCVNPNHVTPKTQSQHIREHQEKMKEAQSRKLGKPLNRKVSEPLKYDTQAQEELARIIPTLDCRRY